MAHNHGATGHAAHNKHHQARCKAYSDSGRHETNKVLGLMRHMRRYGTSKIGEVRDVAAQNVLARQSPIAFRNAEKQLARQRAIGAGER